MSKKSKVLNKKIKVKSKEKTAQKKNSKPVVAKKKNSKPKPATKKYLAPAKSKSVSIKKAVKPLDKKKSGKPAPAAKKGLAKPAKKIQAKAVSAAKPSAAKKTMQNVQSKPSVPIKPKDSPKSASPKKAETPVKSIPKPSAKPKEEKATQASVFSKAEKKTPEVLAVQNTLPVKNKEEISLSKIVSISSSITNAVKKTDSYSIKPEKEPAGKFEMEFVIHSSAEMLYEFLSTPSGLSEWFCDDLNIRNGIYTFIWDDQLMQARLLKTVELQLVRFQWVDKTDGSYFEFRIQKDDLTNDISLIITDFADTSGDRESAKLLWHSQIEKLRHVIGSIF
jgi:uncharacterized protein YndB with AHSA1/START domain